MTCKPIQFEHFNPGEYYFAMCPECKGRLNVFENHEKLEEPEVFGALMKDPIIHTHRCLVRCRCGKTKVLWTGTVETVTGIGCSSTEDNEETLLLTDFMGRG